MSSESYENAFLNAFFIAINIEDILYGVQFLLYFKTLYILLQDGGVYKKNNLFYALFTSIMMLSVTSWMAAQALYGEYMWVRNYDFPGGPYMYWKTNMGVWYMTLAMIMVIILQLTTDALMIYRCRIIWNNHRVVLIPIVLWLITVALGVMVAWSTSSPASDFHTGIAAQFSLAYWSASVFLNTTLTSLICWRVLQHGLKVKEFIGKEYASLYFTLVTVVIESALPYTLSGIAFLVTFGVGSPTSPAFLCVYFMMMCISPQLLILRVAAGRAWDSDTFIRSGSGSVKFSPDSQTGSNTSRAVGRESVSKRTWQGEVLGSVTMTARDTCVQTMARGHNNETVSEDV